jgi:hypothetical protein
MDLTGKLNDFQFARTSKTVWAKYNISFQVFTVENGHSRSHPAEIDRTDTSPRFRTGKARELPVEIGSSIISLEPASEPLLDPTLAKEPPAE